MLYKYSNHFKFILMVLLGFISNFNAILLAYMVQTLTNIATQRNYSNVGKFLIIVISGFIIAFLAGLLFNRLKTNAIKETNIYLRKNIFKGMLAEDPDKNIDGLGFLTNDFKLLETNRFDAQIEITMQIFSLILALSYALTVNWLITLMFLVSSCVPMLASGLFQKVIQNSSEKWTKANSKYVNQTKNFLAGSETLQLYEKQENAAQKNTQKIISLEAALQKMNLLNLDTNSWIQLLGNVVTFLAPFLVGIYMVVKGMTTLGALFAIVQLANSFVSPILLILEDRNRLSTTKKIVEKSNKFLALAEKDSQEDQIDADDIIVEDLTLIRKDQKLAQGINFKIEKGTKTAIIGPSGVGKSTLLQFLMNGKYGHAKKILLNNKEEKAGSFINVFAYASQAPVIFADNLWFNLTLGANISKEEVKKVCDKLDLTKIVEEKGFDYSLGENADQLSGGQLARIELARAILANRSVLLLDEINASLDKKTSDSIHEYLLNSDLTFVEVIHHYQPEELKKYDQVIDLKEYVD
ncbi:ABC transporter ATP-binding protein [Lactobacillus hamsteri]|nr:ABC transporter ATP-binding protein [Lactobacillus hamsteri]